MTVFHIAFILLNLAIPGYIYFRSADSGDTPKIKWDPFEEQLDQIIETSGGFDNCASHDVTKYIRNLCERSMDKWKDNESVIVERASADVVFSCEARNDATFVQWRIEPTEDADLPCSSRQQKGSVTHVPAFAFDREGQFHSIEFDSQSGDRQSIKTQNCQKKLELLLSRKPTLSGSSAARALPRLKSDPADYLTANQMCFDYHIAKDWDKVRGRGKP